MATELADTCAKELLAELVRGRDWPGSEAVESSRPRDATSLVTDLAGIGSTDDSEIAAGRALWVLPTGILAMLTSVPAAPS